MRFARITKEKVVFTAPRTIPDGWKVWGLVDAPNGNGLGRTIPQLKRLTITFSPDREDSAGTREFIATGLRSWAGANPWTAVYTLPWRRAAPKLTGEYCNGRTAIAHLGSYTAQEVATWLQYFASRSGQRIAHFEVAGKSNVPSIQGPWNPFTYRSSELNTASFPFEPLSKHSSGTPTATETVRQMLKKQDS